VRQIFYIKQQSTNITHDFETIRSGKGVYTATRKDSCGSEGCWNNKVADFGIYLIEIEWI